ncbi:MAG: HD domain-containing protein [Gemmatimonadales bacterium]|nr:HD domain-containing protein [Gemmatimonadales bacterium]MYG18406.1 HD domain-containing protein [Gemmatimonadales bacterium]
MARIRTIRDPLWGNVRVEQDAAEILDAPQFQRLRRVKQLGFAHLVYPGGVHNRFLHALGVYHLVSRAISCLERDGHLEVLDAEDMGELPVVRLGALLHDVGHYAFSHALEELGPGAIPGDHEEIAARFMAADPIRRVLERRGPDAAARIGALIRGQSQHPLQGLISGSLDLDKIDYLRRDSLFCGVPYGAVDVDRLLPALTVAREGAGRPLELAVSEKGLSALETLLFSKYQMFRNVYWHHAVRAATLTFVRLVQTALESGLLSSEDLAGPTDEELLSLIDQRIARSSAGGGHDPDSALGRAAKLLRTLVDRRLPKRLVELTGDQLPNALSSWPSRRADLVAALERRMALEWGLSEGAVMLDYPSYPGMLELNLLLVRNDGEVRRLTTLGERGLIDIPRLGRSLHHSARVLRIFSFEPSAPRDPKPVLALIEASEEEVEARLHSGAPLLT